MGAPLSDYWVVEYHFTGDAFSVRPLGDYLAKSQTAFASQKWFDSVILSIHPNEVGARDSAEGWQEKRNKNPTTYEQRIAELTRYVDSMKSGL